MGFLDFLKGKEYREESSDIKEESIEESSELNGEETVEEIVRSAVGEIEEEINHLLLDLIMVVYMFSYFLDTLEAEYTLNKNISLHAYIFFFHSNYLSTS